MGKDRGFDDFYYRAINIQECLHMLNFSTKFCFYVFFLLCKRIGKDTDSVPILNRNQMNEKAIIETLLKSPYERWICRIKNRKKRTDESYD